MIAQVLKQFVVTVSVVTVCYSLSGFSLLQSVTVSVVTVCSIHDSTGFETVCGYSFSGYSLLVL